MGVTRDRSTMLALVMAGLIGLTLPTVAVAGREAGAARAGRGVREARRLRPCDIYARAHTPCVAAYSPTRALFARYDGPLYEVRRASDRATLKVGLLRRGGYANVVPQNRFCARTSCVVTTIYDQTADHN